MEKELYELKTRNEHWILFKFLKLVAIFIGSYVGLWIVFGLLAIPRSRTRRGDAAPQVFADNFDIITDLILYGALAIVVYYVILKIKNLQVERFTFDDSLQQLVIDYKSYFLHIPEQKTFHYDQLSAETSVGQSFLYGDFVTLTVTYNKKRVAFIGKSASDWQRLPKTLARIQERILEVSTP